MGTRRARFAVCAAALALAGLARADCESTVEGSLWADGESRIVGIDGNVQGCNAGPMMFRVGASYYNYGEYNYTGMTGGLRLQPHWVVSPFAGVGFLVGIGEQAVPADQDGKDNDQDGAIDEPGEEAEQRATLFYYPEAGVTLWFGRSFGVTVMGKRYFGEEFNGDLVVSVGVHTALP